METILHIGLASSVVGLILIISEYLYKKKITRGEYSRKISHILVGVWFSVLPFYLSENELIFFFSMVFSIGLLNRYVRVFRSIYSVRRKSFGDILYALGLLLVVAIAREPWIISLAALHIALADGLAAILGRKYGTKYQLKFFTNKKSAVGSSTFFLVSYILTSVFYMHFAGGFHASETLLVISLLSAILLTMSEAFTLLGLDNVSIPLLCAIIANSLI